MEQNRLSERNLKTSMSDSRVPGAPGPDSGTWDSTDLDGQRRHSCVMTTLSVEICGIPRPRIRTWGTQDWLKEEIQKPKVSPALTCWAIFLSSRRDSKPVLNLSGSLPVFNTPGAGIGKSRSKAHFKIGRFSAGLKPLRDLGGYQDSGCWAIPSGSKRTPPAIASSSSPCMEDDSAISTRLRPFAFAA